MRPLFILSRSGQSVEIIRLLKSINKKRIVVGITEDSTSALAKRADYLFDFQANEKAFSNTISFSLSIGYAYASAIGLKANLLDECSWLNKANLFIKEALKKEDK